MALGTAFKAFFSALFNSEKSQQIEAALAGKALIGSESAATPKKEAPKPTPPKPARSEALTLLATLQREARLLDLAQESLDEYTDAQIGAAARDVLKDCKKTLDRMFAIRPLAEVAEGETMDVAEGTSAGQVKLSGSGKYGAGTVIHRGWVATAVELPKWSGKKEDALVVCPIEVETR